jgi:hypothetical protein
MSELDLGLKVASRRMLWRMGYTTRVDVALRSVATAESRRTQGRAQAFTDLDVLGLSIGPGFHVQSAIVDCKTSARGSTERMFWVRGVADFFAADTAYMVRDHELGSAARQLAVRLDITALTSGDVSRLEELHQDVELSDAAPLSWLFDREHVSRSISAFGDLDKRLRPLAAYRQFDYWIYNEHRNLLQMVEHLRACARHLDSRNPVHVALLLDLAWLYLVSLTHAAESIRRSHLRQPDLALQEYLLGGPLGAREKRELSEVLAELQRSGAIPRSVNVDSLPPYYSALRELTIRIIRRPSTVIHSLRLLEVSSGSALGGFLEPVGPSLGPTYDEVAAKQAADVIGFLISSAGLDKGFRVGIRFMLLGEPTDGKTTEEEKKEVVAQQSLLDVSPEGSSET